MQSRLIEESEVTYFVEVVVIDLTCLEKCVGKSQEIEDRQTRSKECVSWGRTFHFGRAIILADLMSDSD